MAAYSSAVNSRFRPHTLRPLSFCMNQLCERWRYARANLEMLISPPSSWNATHTASDFTLTCSDLRNAGSKNCSYVILLSDIYFLNLPPSVTRGLLFDLVFFFKEAVEQPPDLIDCRLVFRSFNEFEQIEYSENQPPFSVHAIFTPPFLL